ncbi:hypothetical protein [Streptomyces melanogenes]|uniref:hypothetical protein n=1 Tax=Streptomyces melanogenes TaxID=67326 RepID=UPI00167DD126|nr:hypothetical protein [Streptomyces melanogenes]GGP72206.1 hypothetical protein GCM10010278_57860 [Streptomyces melanogenes]
MANPKPRKLSKPNGAAVKARGRNWENDLVKVFHDLGYEEAKRNGAIYGSHDRGDIGNVPLTVQAKAVDRIQLWKHLDDALAQAHNNGTGSDTCVVYKRHQAATGEAAWVFPGNFAMRLLDAYYAE